MGQASLCEHILFSPHCGTLSPDLLHKDPLAKRSMPRRHVGLLAQITCLLCHLTLCFSYGWTALDWHWQSALPAWPSSDKQPSCVVISFVNGIYHNEIEWQRITHNLDEIFKQDVSSELPQRTGLPYVHDHSHPSDQLEPPSLTGRTLTHLSFVITALC